MITPGYVLLTRESAPQMPVSCPPMPRPSLKFQPCSGAQSGWNSASISGSIRFGTQRPSGSRVPYGVFAPRSRRLSWMLLRARLAVIAS